MLKLKFFIRLCLAYVSRFKGLILIGIVFGLIIFFGVSKLLPFISSYKTERIGITGRYHPEDMPLPVLEQISGGLTKMSGNGTPEPNLAETWEASENGRVWTFKLAGNHVWQDGREITSEDVNYSFKDVEIEKTDRKTLTFRLKEPFSPFPSVVAKPIFKKGLLGTGEWSVKKITFAGEFVNELLLVNNSKGRILYRFYPTTERTKTAFKLGQIDKIIETTEAEPFLDWPNIDAAAKPNTNQVVAIFFNVNDKLISEKAFRQALLYAIDKSKFKNRAISPISPASWAFNPQVKEYPYDINRAKEIIDGLPAELKSDLKVKLSASPALLTAAEEVARNWKDVEIDAQVQVTPIIPTDYQAFLTILDIPSDPDQYSLWHSEQESTNISKFKDVRVDKLLEDGRSVMDVEERRRLYIDFQRYLLEDVPAGFLYHPVYFEISRKN